jgi:EmrB/QacA subfamily drug resistance transporter
LQEDPVSAAAPETTPTEVGAADAPYRLSPEHRRVFIGLMIGMFVASVSQTIVGPAMPRIVAELGGMDHYSWIAVAAMLVSAVTVPIVGKLSDLYGRRAFYLGGLVTFMVGSLVAWQAQNFGMLVAARAIQGLGMGTLMPLSQTIIGDIIPPRQRGKYQGLMGSVFGLTSVAGPLAGGWITDTWGWRYLFLVSIPFGIVALFVIGAFLKLDQPRREAKIDVAGICTLTVGLVLTLLATSFGGSTWAWGSVEVITSYVVGTLFLVAFVFIECRAEEPVLPLRLFRNRTFTLSVLASFFISMMMFGAIIYIPVYAQGVLGVSATNSGLILMPLMVALVVVGILGGMIITRTGRYKELCVLGVVVMGVGYSLLTRMGYDSTQTQLTLAMAVVGVGLGACMQVFTLVVQNNLMRADMGVGTAAVQFFRNVGSTVGIAVFGTIMTTRMPGAIATHLPPQVAAQMKPGSVNAGSVLDPGALAKLPPVVAEAVRRGLADSLHDVFLAALPLAAVALVLTLGIKAMPLRDTIHSAEDTGREMLDAMGSASPTGDGLVPALGRDSAPSRTKERLLGVQLGLLADEAQRGDRPLLAQAIADLGDGDLERGVALLGRTAVMLTTEDVDTAAKAEKYAAEVVARGERPGGVLSEDLRRTLATASARQAEDLVLTTVEPRVLDRYEGVDFQSLFSVNTDLTAALMLDIRRMRDMLAT